MRVKFDSAEEARRRLSGNTPPLTEDDVRALFTWFYALSTAEVARLQAEIALMQIKVINRFNEQSGRLMKTAIFVSCAQIVLAVATLVMTLCRR